MVCVLLAARIGSVSHERFVEPIQCYLSQTANVSASGSHHTVNLFKEKSSGGEVPCSCATPIAPNVRGPFLDDPVPHLLFCWLPAVYREIFIPPECLPLPA